MYVPAVFVVEEVFFRGLLDTHVHRTADSGGWSAVGIGALWGLWHLPLIHPSATGLLRLLALHTAVGVPLSVAWRRSGNLAVPGITHAAIDAIRNALLL